MTGLRARTWSSTPTARRTTATAACYLTRTCAGLRLLPAGALVASGPSTRPTPHDMRLESQRFSRRDGLALDDHAGQLVRDGDRWLVCHQPGRLPGPARIHVRHTSSHPTTCSRACTSSRPSAPPLPTALRAPGTRPSPALAGRWHVTFVESPSPAAFPVSSGPRQHAAVTHWSDGLEPTWRRTTCGGARARAGLPSRGPPGCRSPPTAGTGLPSSTSPATPGRRDAPYPTSIPHPQLVPDPAGGWLVITFDCDPPRAARCWGTAGTATCW